MNKKKANEIMKKVIAGWKKKIPKGAKLHQPQIDLVRKTLEGATYDDGLMRVTSVMTGKTHLVPYEDIILNGLRHEDLPKYKEAV